MSLKCTYSFLADTWQLVPLHNAREHLNPWCIWATRHCVSGSCFLEPAYKEHKVHHWGFFVLGWVLGFFYWEWGSAWLFLPVSQIVKPLVIYKEAHSTVWRYCLFLAWIVHTFRNALEWPKPSVSLLLPKMLAKNFGARHHPECIF